MPPVPIDDWMRYVLSSTVPGSILRTALGGGITDEPVGVRLDPGGELGGVEESVGGTLLENLGTLVVGGGLELAAFGRSITLPVVGHTPTANGWGRLQ